jgi:hypothetical protein
MGMESEIRSASEASVYLFNRRILTPPRRLKKLSKGTHLLNQHNTDICDALRRIQLDMTMSKDEIRLAIDEILAMVCCLAQLILAAHIS